MSTTLVVAMVLQVNAVETLYFQLLGEVEALEAPVAADMAALQEQRSRVAALHAALPC
jgi:hypothetical protein